MNTYRASILNPIKFGLFKLSALPMAFLAGLKVEQLENDLATVSVRHGYINKNPFKSMYFAVQAMAAELSTGLLVMERVQLNKSIKISMLVLGMQAQFKKKATGIIRFRCENGQELDSIFKEVIETGEGRTIVLKSEGVDQAGDVVSSFEFTWTMKRK